MIDVSGSGLFRKTGPPEFGKQDQGISPKGAMDLFSYRTGNLLLGNPEDAPALEMIVPPKIRFTKNGLFVLTGAPMDRVTISGQHPETIAHACVCRARRGQALDFGTKRYGLRTYLCMRDADSGIDETRENMKRGPFDKVASWPDPKGLIRVIRGPEWSMLEEKNAFFNQRFIILPESSAMGLRLKAASPGLVINKTRAMISEPVSDGTVQLTPSGPVVLLRHRQTMGGYPRIFNVITPDLDILAQYAPGQFVRFSEVSREQALDVAGQWEKDLAMIRRRPAKVFDSDRDIL